MDMENQAPAPKSSSKTPIILISVVVLIIIVGAIVFAMSNKQEVNQTAVDQTPAPTSQEVEATSAGVEYNNGTYDAVGNYTSPGGEETIDVTLTLADGVITDATVASNATRPISKQMQSAFIEGFKEQVVGKNIDEVNVTKVSSSSLTPKGFMDALEKVKTQASA